MTSQEKAMRHANAIQYLKTKELKREYKHVLCQYLIDLLKGGK